MAEEKRAPSRPATPDKLQPHNIEAEEAVLGALLIDPDAIIRIATFLKAKDFFLQRNTWIYDAILTLHSRREPTDLITLTDELERQNHLADIGGPAYLTDLINVTPTSIHVEYYAKIVERTAILRRLIDGATQIAQLAYEDAEEIAEIIDRAESIIFGVTERRTDRDLKPIRQAIDQYYDLIEYRSQHQGELMGIPTGLKDLDKLLGGLQRSDLIVLAGRPGMGKCVSADTRLIDPYTGDLVTIADLVQRRQADLLTLDNQYKLQATEASDFIDDGMKPVYRVTTTLGREIKVTLSHPFLTIKGWQSLGTLNLGDKIAVPRVVPVFGRHDAPEHEVKILAYLLGDDCLVGQTLQLTNDDPRLTADFEAAVGDFHDTKTQSHHTSDDISAKPRWQHRLNSQQDQHRVRSQSQLATTMHIAPTLTNQVMPAVYTSEQPDNSFDLPLDQLTSQKLTKTIELRPHTLIEECVPKFGKARGERGVSPRIPPGFSQFPKIWDAPLIEWLQAVGVWGQAETEQEIPTCVYRYTRPKLALFLNCLFAAGGCINHQDQQDKPVAISYHTVAVKLARGIQHLLLRFGIIAQLHHHQVKYAGISQPVYEVRIMGATNLQAFLADIGIFGRETAVAEMRTYLEQSGMNTDTDTIPLDIGPGEPTRDRLLAIGQALQSDRLTHLAQSDIYWDKIVRIEYLGKQPVYDLTVPETHNFLADDMIVHNTSLGLSMALQSARKWNKRIAIFSLEMSDEQLVQRLLSAETGIDSQRLRLGQIRDDEWPVFIQATSLLADTSIFLDDTPAISVMELRTKARRLEAEHGLDLIIVDYMQLMRGDVRSENRQQEISYISRSLKELARELNIPVLALSQLSRAVESRHDKRPMLSDLRESGSIEQDADVVMFVYRDEIYNPDTEFPNLAEIIVAKHRSGPTGFFSIYFKKQLAQFVDLEVRTEPLDY